MNYSNYRKSRDLSWQVLIDNNITRLPVKVGEICKNLGVSVISYEKGYEITVDDDMNGELFVAGAVLKEGKLLTNGGRVLGATEIADTLEDAIDGAYKLVSQISFEGAYYRRDIGAKALRAREEK